MTAVLELSDVVAGYGPFRALFGVSLTVDPGEAVALVGSNGAGKTTVARVASGLVDTDSGTVMVDGADLTRAQPYQLRTGRRGPRPRGSIGLRHVHGRGEPDAVVPAA